MIATKNLVVDSLVLVQNDNGLRMGSTVGLVDLLHQRSTGEK